MGFSTGIVRCVFDDIGDGGGKKDDNQNGRADQFFAIAQRHGDQC